MMVIVQKVALWVLTPCRALGRYPISEEHVASIFKVQRFGSKLMQKRLNHWPFFLVLEPWMQRFSLFGSNFYSPQAALIITMEQMRTATVPRFMRFNPRAETCLCLINHTLFHNGFSKCGGHQMDWTNQMNCWNHCTFHLEHFPAILAWTYNVHSI
jgi:hypothetical protein